MIPSAPTRNKKIEYFEILEILPCYLDAHIHVGLKTALTLGWPENVGLLDLVGNHPSGVELSTLFSVKKVKNLSIQNNQEGQESQEGQPSPSGLCLDSPKPNRTFFF